jgi:hypothetical protein
VNDEQKAILSDARASAAAALKRKAWERDQALLDRPSTTSASTTVAKAGQPPLARRLMKGRTKSR